MGRFLQRLEKDYQDYQNNHNTIQSRLAYLAEEVFDFTTYDDNVSEYLSKKMIEVLEVILNRNHRDYISNQANYLNYILMVNSTFIKDRLDWGTSIRFTWLYVDSRFDDGGKYGLREGREDIEELCKDIIEFSKKK